MIDIPRITAIRRDRRRLQGLLPWYLNGTLADADRAWLEQRLRACRTGVSDAAGRGLAFDRRIVAAFEQDIAKLPPGIGWDRLLRQVRTHAVGVGAGEAVPLPHAGHDRGTCGTIECRPVAQARVGLSTRHSQLAHVPSSPPTLRRLK